MTSAGLDGARLAVLVHEVRSPVAALAAVAEAIPETAAHDPARRELVRLAVGASRAIERIVLDLAVASVRPERLDVALLVREAVASHLVRGGRVTAEVADSALFIEGDPVRLRQALDNLIANAVAYGGSAPVVVRVDRTDDDVRIAVRDSGPGVPSDELTRIFELGRRLSVETPGSGLGLTVAQAIATAHGGTIEVDSTPGIGSTFTIVLPADGRSA